MYRGFGILFQKCWKIITGQNFVTGGGGSEATDKDKNDEISWSGHHRLNGKHKDVEAVEGSAKNDVVVIIVFIVLKSHASRELRWSQRSFDDTWRFGLRRRKPVRVRRFAARDIIFLRPQWLQNGVERKWLREGRRHRTMGSGVGGRRVWHWWPGGRRRRCAGHRRCGDCGGGDGAAPREGMVDGVVMERLRKGHRPRTMDCGGGGRRVGSRRAGVEIIMVAARAHSEATTHKQPYKRCTFTCQQGQKKHLLLSIVHNINMYFQYVQGTANLLRPHLPKTTVTGVTADLQLRFGLFSGR
jgi:hypothetical protein